MHPCIQLDVDGEIGDTFALGCMNKSVQQAEAIDFRLQMVLEECVETGELRIHYHDIGRDTCTTQFHALVCHSHSEVVYAVVLQRLRNFHGTCPIGRSLDHTNDFGLGLHERTVVV